MLKLVEFQKYDFVHYLQLADSPTHMPLKLFRRLIFVFDFAVRIVSEYFWKSMAVWMSPNPK